MESRAFLLAKRRQEPTHSVQREIYVTESGGRKFDDSYFKEMFERIRDIRLSERRLYLQIADIFALASDYEKYSQAGEYL
jgi:hypothetical protein